MKNLIRYILVKIETRIAQRKVFNELSKLTDRELYDMGILRSDIYSIAYGFYDGNKQMEIQQNA